MSHTLDIWTDSMAKIRLTKEFSFESAHALDGYDGLCREIHGHSYRLFVTIKGEPISEEGDPTRLCCVTPSRMWSCARCLVQSSAKLCLSTISQLARICSRTLLLVCRVLCLRMWNSIHSVCTRQPLPMPSGLHQITKIVLIGSFYTSASDSKMLT